MVKLGAVLNSNHQQLAKVQKTCHQIGQFEMKHEGRALCNPSWGCAHRATQISTALCVSENHRKSTSIHLGLQMNFSEVTNVASVKNEYQLYLKLRHFMIILYTHTQTHQGRIRGRACGLQPWKRKSSPGSPAPAGEAVQAPSPEQRSAMVWGPGWWILESHWVGSKASSTTYLLGDLGKFPELCVYKSCLVNLYWISN